MFPLDFRQVSKQFSRRGIRRFFHGALVESPRLQLHDFHLFANCVDSQRPHQPHRAALGKSLHVLRADQRNVLAESLAVHLKQTLPVPRFLDGHLIEYFRSGGIRHAQAFGEISVDAAVLLLHLNRQRQNFLVGKVLEFFLGHERRPRMYSSVTET